VKLVIFAHTPPPFHGQSFMVKLMLDNFGGDHRGKVAAPADGIECFHVNARFSNDLANIGSFSMQKIFRLVKFCVEAIWCRFHYGADIFYYIPAPPKRFAFYRDCFVMFLCRPFFRRVVFHWQASGLGEWLQCKACSWERWIARLLLGSPDLSMTLARSLSNDAAYFQSKRTCVTPNGIVDPCPDFEELVCPRRRARLTQRRELFNQTISSGDRQKYSVVFLAHCTRDKGLFDTLHAIALANQQLDAQMVPVSMHLTVAGAFLNEDERQEFESWRAAHRDEVDYVGFLGAEAKAKLLRESDCLCFPTFYSAEAQPVSVIEAMAFGLTVVTSSWRGIPELLPENYPFSFSKYDPPMLAQALVDSMRSDVGFELRRHYCEALTEKRYMENLRQALQLVSAPLAR
jgi:glycosyltransferase involved in cell wall biosynthesis